MPIMDWCRKVQCDKCRYLVYFPYSAERSLIELAKGDGWKVDDRALCPRCAATEEREEQAKAERKGWRKWIGGKRHG